MEPITFEIDDGRKYQLLKRRLGDLQGIDEPANWIDLRAAGFVRVPSAEELVDTINFAEEAWCDSPEEAMDCGPYVARAILRALGVQS